MPHLYYLRNMKQYCNYYMLLYTAWCNVKRTVQARIQMQLIAKVPLSLIHLHLSSMTECSELGNGSQKVPCYDD